jgi:hypothetical protein
MAYTKNVFKGNEIADASEVNANFAEIYTSLVGFPDANASLADDAVATDNIDAGAVTKVKLATALIDTDPLNDPGTDETLPTSLAVRTYVDTEIATANHGFCGKASSNKGANDWVQVPLTKLWGSGDAAVTGYTVVYPGTYEVAVVGHFGMYASTTLKVAVRHYRGSTWINDPDGEEVPGENIEDSYVNGPYTTGGVEYQQSVGATGQLTGVLADDTIEFWAKASGSSLLNSGDRSILTIYKTG